MEWERRYTEYRSEMAAALGGGGAEVKKYSADDVINKYKQVCSSSLFSFMISSHSQNRVPENKVIEDTETFCILAVRPGLKRGRVSDLILRNSYLHNSSGAVAVWCARV